MEDYYFKTLHGCFSHFLNYTNGTKSRKASYRKSLIGAADWLELFLRQFHNLLVIYSVRQKYLINENVCTNYTSV